MIKSSPQPRAVISVDDGDETLIARPLGKLRMVNGASPAYLERVASVMPGLPPPSSALPFALPSPAAIRLRSRSKTQAL